MFIKSGFLLLVLLCGIGNAQLIKRSCSWCIDHHAREVPKTRTCTGPPAKCAPLTKQCSCSWYVDHLDIEIQNTRACTGPADCEGAHFCHGRDDGRYQDPEDCHDYIHCSGHYMYLYSCDPHDQVFNEETDHCDYMTPCYT